MDFKKLTDRAKGLVNKRGGTDALKEDLSELKDIAKGPGSAGDKAKAAAAALKDPGAKGQDAAPAGAAEPAAPAPTTPAAPQSGAGEAPAPDPTDAPATGAPANDPRP